MSWISSAVNKASRFVKKKSATIVKGAAIAGAGLFGGPAAAVAVAAAVRKGKQAIDDLVTPVVNAARNTAAEQIQEAGVEAANAAGATIAVAGSARGAVGPPSPIAGITQRQLWIVGGSLLAALFLIVLVFLATGRRS